MTTLRRYCGAWGLLLSLAISLTPQSNADELTTFSSSGNKTNSAVLMRYKQMSLRELMNQDVTSVSKEPEPYSRAPAAVQVITGDEIRRFGASSIPEALRLADNLDVAQASSGSWDISARGFNPPGFSDKLLVLIDGRTV